MNIANIGIGLGSLADGFIKGLSLGRQLKGIQQENELERIRREGLSQAEQQREQDISKLIQEISLPSDVGPTRGFQVGDKTFTDQAAARKAAERLVDSTADYFYRYHAPKIRDTYIAQGDVDKATKWDEMIRSQRGRRAVKDWSSLWMNFNAGNYDKAIQGFSKYYSSYVDPSISVKSYEIVESEAGPIAKLALHDSDTGTDFEMELDRSSFTQLALAYNPADLARIAIEQESAASRMRAEDAREERKFRREQMGKERLELLKARLKAQYGEGVADAAMRAYRAGRPPEDAITDIFKMLRSDISNLRLSDDELLQRARDTVYEIYRLGEEIRASRLPPGPQDGLFIFDQQTGQGWPVDMRSFMQLPQEPPGQPAPAASQAPSGLPAPAASQVPSGRPTAQTERRPGTASLGDVEALVDEIAEAEGTIRAIQSGEIMSPPAGALRATEQKLAAARQRLENLAARMGTTPEALVQRVERQRQVQRAQRDLANVEKQLADQQRLLAQLEGASDLRSRERAAFLRRSIAALLQERDQLAAIIRSPGVELANR